MPAGVSDADALLAALVEGEEANFSLFSYVNELSGEVDKTEAHIAELRCVGVGWGCVLLSLVSCFVLQCGVLLWGCGCILGSGNLPPGRGPGRGAGGGAEGGADSQVKEA